MKIYWSPVLRNMAICGAVAAITTAAGATTIFSENFNSATVGSGTVANGWTTTTNTWGGTNSPSSVVISNDSTSSGNLALNYPAAGGRGGYWIISKPLGATVTQSWEVTFDYAWHWGDGGINNGVGIALRSPTAPAATTYNGYGLNLWQGNGVSTGVGKYDAGRFQLVKYDGYNHFISSSSTLIAAAASATYVKDQGYLNNTTWGTPAGVDKMYHARLTWDAATHTLTGYYRLADETAWTQVVQAVDTGTSSFSEIALFYAGSGGVTSVYDNLHVSIIPEPASMGLLTMGAGMCMLRRRRPSPAAGR